MNNAEITNMMSQYQIEDSCLLSSSLYSAVDAWLKLITPLHLHHDWPPPLFDASAYSTELVYNYI